MDIREIMAKANDKKSGDTLAGIASENALERVRAREKLASLTVHDLFEHPAVPYEEDAVTRIIIDDVDQKEYRKIQNWTIGDLREWLLDDATTGDRMLAAGRGMSSEVIAGVCKLMGNLDLMLASSKMHIEKTCNTTIGGPNVLASRLQPNHPVDSPKGVTASTLRAFPTASATPFWV